MYHNISNISLYQHNHIICQKRCDYRNMISNASIYKHSYMYVRELDKVTSGTSTSITCTMRHQSNRHGKILTRGHYVYMITFLLVVWEDHKYWCLLWRLCFMVSETHTQVVLENQQVNHNRSLPVKKHKVFHISLIVLHVGTEGMKWRVKLYDICFWCYWYMC